MTEIFSHLYLLIHSSDCIHFSQLGKLSTVSTGTVHSKFVDGQMEGRTVSQSHQENQNKTIRNRKIFSNVFFGGLWSGVLSPKKEGGFNKEFTKH